MRMIVLASAALLAISATAPGASAQPGADDAPPPTMVPDIDTSTPPTPPRHARRPVPFPPASMGEAKGGEAWAHEPGTGLSGPASDRASNISGGDSPSSIAPHLPEPQGGENAGWRNYLREADGALAMNRTGQAQQALEMAETRLLDRSTPVDRAGEPLQSPAVVELGRARQALGAGDIAGARFAIRMALSAPEGGEPPQ